MSTTPASETPIYDTLLRELTTGWPDHALDVDPPTLPLPVLDSWFAEWPEIRHMDDPDRSLFPEAVVAP